MQYLTLEELEIELKPDTLVCGNCLQVMPFIAGKSIDLILCDLPYGATSNSWDIPLPLDLLWKQYNRILKDNGLVLLTATQPYATHLINSAPHLFQYDLIWDKTKGGNFLLAKKMPMKTHEIILVFYSKQPTYNPQMVMRGNVRKKGGGKASSNFLATPTVSYNNEYYPHSIIVASTGSRKDHFHPTQKPVYLMEYLITTYTNVGDVVLDNCMGAGSTGVGALQTNRKFIGIEKEANYFEIAKKRLSAIQKKWS